MITNTLCRILFMCCMLAGLMTPQNGQANFLYKGFDKTRSWIKKHRYWATAASIATVLVIYKFRKEIKESTYLYLESYANQLEYSKKVELQKKCIESYKKAAEYIKSNKDTITPEKLIELLKETESQKLNYEKFTLTLEENLNKEYSNFIDQFNALSEDVKNKTKEELQINKIEKIKKELKTTNIIEQNTNEIKDQSERTNGYKKREGKNSKYNNPNLYKKTNKD